MFQGTSLVSLDAKGRLSLPVRYREGLMLTCQGEVTITRHPDGCVLIFPRAVWIALKAKLMKLPYSARVLRRILIGSAVDVKADGSGRLLIPNELRCLCGLTREVALMGLGDHFELWDQAALAEFEKKELAKDFSETLEDFVL